LSRSLPPDNHQVALLALAADPLPAGLVVVVVAPLVPAVVEPVVPAVVVAPADPEVPAVVLLGSLVVVAEALPDGSIFALVSM